MKWQDLIQEFIFWLLVPFVMLALIILAIIILAIEKLHMNWILEKIFGD